MPKDPKPKLCRADYGGRAALNRMTLPENNPTERLTRPIPNSARRGAARIVFEGDISDPEVAPKTPKKRRPRKFTRNDSIRCISRLAEQLPVNEVVIPINFSRLANHAPQKQPIPEFDAMYWNDNTPRRAVSSDGVTLVVTVPCMVKSQGMEKINKDVMDYAKKVKPLQGKSVTSAEKTGEYVDRPGQVAGEIRLVRSWFAIGQANKGSLVPSSDTIATGAALAATCDLYRKLAPLSERVNEVMRIADPAFYKNLELLRKKVEAKFAIGATMNHEDPLLLEGRELLFNRKSGLHRDSQDPQLGYAGLFAAGSFTGGDLELPELKLRIRLQPGDLVLIRGRVLKHGIQEWDGGQRICIPHFTHTDLWTHFGLGDLVSVPKLSQVAHI